MNCDTIVQIITVRKWHMAITCHFSPSTDILLNLLPYPSTVFPLYYQQQKRNLKHYESGVSRHIFPAHLASRL